MRIVLASASPRRRELLEQIGLTFEIMVSDAEEKITTTEPADAVEELSCQKAMAVLKELSAQKETAVLEEHSGQKGTAVLEERSCQKKTAVHENLAGCKEAILIIGADTVVAAEGKILGKPGTPEMAEEMLRTLSGRRHEVYTGVTLLLRGADGTVQRKTFHECTRVTFYDMSREEMKEYIATGDCMDKAGAYGIQGFCARYIKGIDGEYNNVVGLPVARLYQEAKEWLL